MRKALSALIHIFAGENVCIHIITPMQALSVLAAAHISSASALFLTTGFASTSAMAVSFSPKYAAISFASAAA